ncbi:hypothetical protein DEU56DRAFT_937900 [Suillus clintonianus]|uniref:uncharacterized protein n=1 Tax=Suillus clintonianus TaxID=1904413 RepID=UPI001B85D102|nr:uncharacterized protein DEU56DRAFT_937900 [Suillus clintonianus]KAG2144236.1 hypothetical protein DEU56DRAFT_937900 [Suillus clintonianus]
MRLERRNITSNLPSTPSTHQSAPPDEGDLFCFTADDDSMPMDDILGDNETLHQRRKQMAADNPILVWKEERDTYLAELIRLDGRGDSSSDVCGECCAPAQFRCLDCDDLQLYCRGCTVANHLRSPTHRIQEWTGVFFQAVSLKDLGLRVQLGHPVGQRCILPQQVSKDEFVLIDTNGIHELGLDFCGCETSNSHVRQLLRHGWFPSTATDPRTAATFRLLRHFQILSFESKASAYEFYHSLVRLTDNSGLTKPKDRYNAFLRMVREWRHLKMLKRFGRGHEPSGVKGTSQGECVVVCPACPQPGKNLVDGWALATKANRWLYATFLAIDANFRLKRRNVSSDEADPSLSTGWSYFVEETDYKSYLAQHLGGAQEKSTCSSHNAVNMADTKLSQGLAATGVGTVDCARHNMKRANGVGDLQKGEKYINMDYLFFSSLRDNSVKMLNVSYDIACQWHKHLWSRMESLPRSHHLDYLSKVVRFFVPKFHLPAHVAKCQTIFSFNFTRFVGRTDGEAPERGWSNINPVATSTKNMGPGCRRDTLDDHFGDWNWKKVVGLGASLLHKMKDARVEKAEHQAAFEEFDAVITPEHRAAWLSEMEGWEENPNDTTILNPFETKAIAITQAGARLKLAELEAEELAHGVDVSLHPEISPSVLIAAGLDIEDEQRRLTSLIKSMGLHSTDTQRGNLVRQRNSLRRKIEMWKGVQVLYMPAVRSLVQGGREDQKNAEDITLWLPSQLRNKPCDQRLQNDEWELRYAQAHDALEELRQCLRIHCSLLTFKREWMRGQGANTRGQNALARVHARRTMCVIRYRSAWTALKSLAMLLGKKDWHGKLQELADEHIKPLVDPFGIGEGRRQVSWIWMMEGLDCNGYESADDGVRIEWCKSRARALRWMEEVELLTEEMGRVIRFFGWEVQRWEERISRCVGESSANTEGLRAYAARQADIRRRLAGHFRGLWAPYLPQTLELPLPIISPQGELQLPDLTIPDIPLDE